MAANPIARDDLAYYTPTNTNLVVTISSSPAAPAVNDLDIDSTALTYSVVTHPTNGTLVAFNSNGTFTYQPNPGFTGVDTFTYRNSDGVNTGNTASIAIAVGTRLLGRQNLDSNYFSPLGDSLDLFSRTQPAADGQLRSNIPQGSSLGTDGSLAASGGLQLMETITPDQALIYRSNALTNPIIAVDTQLAPGVAVPSAISARLTFNGVAGPSFAYSTTGLAMGQAMRFALQADGSSLPTGVYDYTLTVTMTISGGTFNQSFSGRQAIVNRSASEYGAGWWLDGLDRIHDGAAGALLVRGNGDTLWFAKSGTTYQRAAGDTNVHSLVKNGNGTYTLTSKTGTVFNFSTLGLLTSVVDPNGNTTALAYADRDSDGIADELISITDPFSRVTNLTYTAGKVTSVSHFSGRTITLTHSGANLASYTLPDPDGTGPQTAPMVSFVTTGSQLSSRTNPLSQTTSFTFNANDGRLRTVTYPDTRTWQLTPIDTIGLPTASTGNTLRRPVDAQATVTDERGNLWRFRTDRFGGVTESITAMGFVRTVMRSSDGLPYVLTDADPDGTGPLSSSVTLLGYNTALGLSHIIAADGGVTTMTYSSSLNRLLSMTDPLNRTKTFTYSATGNMLTAVDAAGFTTTYAYNARGLTTSVTPPDPDGAGPLTAPVTGLAYDTLGRLITLTNPDASTQTFTYNAADQLLTHRDEFNNATSLVYDNLGNLTSVTDRIAAQTQYQYDALSRRIKQIDALGNTTDMEYNNRGWVSKITFPDADGTGPLQRAIQNLTFDAVGNVVSQGEPTGNYTATFTNTYDADHRRISQGDPASPSVGVNWTYDNAGRLIRTSRASMSPGLADQTIVDYDSVNRVIRQRVQSQTTMGPGPIRFQESYAYNTAGELTAYTDGRGNTTQYAYEARGLLRRETLPDPDGAGSQFSLVVNYGYDNMGRAISMDRGFGRVTTAAYNNRSWITRITSPDPDGAGPLGVPITNIAYTVRGDRASITDPLGRVTAFTYDNNQRMISQTDPDPDGVGPLTSPVTSYNYNSLGWVTNITNPSGGVTSYTYDGLGRQQTQTDPDPDAAGPLSAPVTTLTYNATGLWQVTDPMGRVTSFTRDVRGRVTGVTDPIGNITNFTYDSYNNLLTKTEPDPDGSGPLPRPVTSWTYDSLDRVISKTDAKGGSTWYTYDLASNLTSLRDPVNNTTNFGYDSLNRLVLDTNAQSKSKSYVYDVAGNLTRTVDRNGRMIQYSFDTLDRQTEERWQQSGSSAPTLTVNTTQQGGPVSERQSVGWTTGMFGLSGTFTLSHGGQTTAPIAWNATAATIQTALEGLSTIGAGNIAVNVTVTGSFGRTIDLTFLNARAAIDVPQSTINTANLVPIMSGVASFNTTTVTGSNQAEVQTLALSNASGGTWRVAYDGEVSAPLSPTITAAQLKTALDAFNGIDNVAVTGANGNFTVTFGGTQSTTNMQQIFGDAANASNGTTTRTITTAYDVASQMTSVSDPSSSINFTYDNLGRTTALTQSVAGLTPSVTFNQTFDAMSNRTELQASIGATLDFKNTYQYDKLQRLTDIVQQGQTGGNAVTAKHVTQSFNALNQRTQIARFQSTGTANPVATTNFTYDTANRLSGIAHKQGATNLNTYAYTYDPLSRIATIVSTLDGTDTYSYDQTSQLTGATHTTHANETYGFDANGNRNTAGFTTAVNNRTTVGLGFTYTYDDEGNRTSKTETATGKVEEYSWDYRNRLTLVVSRNSTGGAIVKQVDYEYDAFNRLVRRTFDADGAGAGAATNQYWVYDEGINAVLQFDGSAASNLSHRYLWSDNVDELLADEVVTSPSSGGNVLWGLADHLGTIRDIADLNESTGSTSITNHRRFNSFGALVSESNATVDLLFAYTGKQFDEATALQHNWFRWYDPALGQWLSEDPLGFAAGDENVRRYVGNGVVDSIDPTGLQEPTFNYSTMYLNESFRAGVPLSAYGPQTDFGSYAWNYTGHFIDAWGDYITWWNGTPGGDTFDQVATGVTATGQIVGVAFGTVAGGVYVWGVVGAPTMGAGIVTTSETSVIFTVNGSTFMGTSSGLVSVPTGYYTLGYWTSITGVPILSGKAAIAGAGGGLWISNHPCLSRAIQAFVHGWLPFVHGWLP